MKKKEVKKIRLSKETLRELESSDGKEVVGGVITALSCQSWMCCEHTVSGDA